jgi:hypothetical protein
LLFISSKFGLISRHKLQGLSDNNLFTGDITKREKFQWN